MRLVRLSVQQFQCIESAELELGPGLNVLYGPNDLGKSSLAWAIRAALLLPHGSALHERFIPWYGGGEPRVALTLCDDDDRYWKVSKTFGAGSVGRSRLESSKDGREFTTEATGRQVDDKLRLMLRWGVQRPGGPGGQRGLPSSFLTQVLLAEQDRVLGVLESGLGTDPHESGRQRLTEALDALAQDPLFKSVLDVAQAQADSAFTSTGQKKRGRGSPYVAVADLIVTMQRERDELEAKVRESAAAEARIQALGQQRDRLHRDVETAGAALELARKRAQLATEQAKVVAVAAVQAEIDRLNADLPRRRAAEEASAVAVREAAAAAGEREGERDAARARLDGLSHPDPAAEQRLRALDERRKNADEQFHDAERAVEREKEALRLARACAGAVVEGAAAVVATREAAAGTDAAALAAAGDLTRAQQALDEARQRLREVESGDRVLARERQRAELENRRLTLEAERTQAAQAAERAAAVGQAVRRAEEAEVVREALGGDVEKARAAVAEHQAAVAASEAARATLRKVELFAQLQQVKTALARAAALRQEATALRAQVPDGLPAAEAIAGVRALGEELRLAEARLGGGLSVTVRSTKRLVVETTQDGGEDARRTMKAGDEVTLAAARELALAIDGLLEIEISAGEERARKAAAALKKKWNREGAPLLRAQKVETVEALALRRAEADAALRAAAEREREADQADEAALGARLGALEKDLGGEDRRPLAAALEGLGPEAFGQRATALEREREAHASRLAGARDQLTRLETLRDAQIREAKSAQQEASRLQAEVSGDWAAELALQQAASQAADRALEATATSLAALSGGADDEQQAAHAQVATTERAVAVIQQWAEEAQLAARTARDAAVQATTRLDDARARARELDRKGSWTAALATDVPDLRVTAWQEALAAAEERREACQRERVAVTAERTQLDEQRRTAIEGARAEYTSAEERARAARAGVAEAQEAAQKLASEHARIAADLADLRVQAASANLAETNRTIAALQAELTVLEADTAPSPAPSRPVAEEEKAFARLAAHLRDTEDDLTKARGALEQVGGAVVRERQRDLDHAIAQARERERATEIEFDAWKLLVDTLRETESAEGAHLGRALAGPVSERFRSLTGGRYDRLELGPQLDAAGLRAAGDLRELGALSAGTQDQLATLLRVCIAEHLRSAIVLDDHLSQSDPARVDWFNAILRTAARQVQIILITCRPSEVLSPDELPAPGEPAHSAAAGLVRVVDLTRVITRFGAPSPAAPGINV